MIALSELPTGVRALIASIDAAAARVDKLAALGILPGVEVTIQQKKPTFVIECGETVLALERDLADGIKVTRIDG